MHSQTRGYAPYAPSVRKQTSENMMKDKDEKAVNTKCQPAAFRSNIAFRHVFHEDQQAGIRACKSCYIAFPVMHDQWRG